MKLGIIAESREDVEVLRILGARITGKTKFSTAHFVSHGCGKLRNRCEAWAAQLESLGCDLLVVAHDSDGKNAEIIHAELAAKIGKAKFRGRIVLVPVEELEAWLLSDPTAVQKAFELRKVPKIPKNPELLKSPKEFLRNLVWREGGKRYVNSIHNTKLAQLLDVKALQRCPSFAPFPTFLLAHSQSRSRKRLKA